MTQVVTELVIDGRDATSGAAAYEAAMARVEAAHDKAAAAQQRQATLLPPGTPQSADKATAAFAKLQASIDPVAAAGHRAAQEMTRALALVDRAVMLGVTTQIEADATIARLRQRQIADVDRVWQAQQKLNDTPANDNVAGARRFNTGNIAAQFQDIGVTAAMGMNPLTIALQQGTQLSAVFAQMEDPIRGVGEAFKSIISPTALVTIGLVALVAVGLQFVDWPKLAAGAMNLLADALETIAPYAAIAAAGLALLYAPAIVSGVVSVIALLGRLAVAAVIAAGAMAAANPALALVAGFTIAVAAGNIFRDELTQILGFDIVGAAKRGGNLIIGAFVGGFEYIKTIWNNLPAVVASATLNAANAAINGIESMINNAAGLLDAMIDKINAGLSNLPGGVQIGKIGTFDLPEIINGVQDQSDSAFGEAESALQKSLSRDYLGEFGEAIAKGASAASAKLKELAADLTKVDDKSKKSRGKTDAEKYDDIIDGANRRIESLKAEQAALGLSEHAALALRYETDMLNEAQRKGIDLTTAQRDQIEGLASTMATLEIAIRKAQEAMDFAKDLTRGFIDDLRSGLASGKGFWESFGNAALNVLDKITSKLLDEVLDALFKVNNAGSGGGGLLDWLFKGLGNIFGGFTDTDILTDAVMPWNAPAVQASTMRLDRAPAVSTPAVSMSMGRQSAVAAPRMQAPANGNQGGAQNVHVTVGVSVDDDGKIQSYVAKVEERTAASTQASLNQFEDTMPDKIVAHRHAPRRRHSRSYRG